MENNSYHVPFYVVTGGVKLSGHSSELRGGAVGLYDRNTFSVATSIGNGKELFFAQGNIGGKDWYGHPITETHKSAYFFGKDVEDMYVSYPQTIQNEEWVIGFNGSPSSKGISWEKGKPVRVKLYFHGDPVYRFFGGVKEYVVSHTPLTDCTEPCNASDCPGGITDCITETMKLIDNINNHTELKKFGVQAKLVTEPYTAGVVNMEKYQMCICDNGDSQALQAVQMQYPDKTVTRVSRAGSTSCYEFCQRADDAAPEDFAQLASISFSICGVCPTGSTFVPAEDVYYVSRPIVGGEDFSSDVSKAAHAADVATAYFPAITFNGATAVEVTPASDAITLTAHNLVTGQIVTYTNGGGTSITGLTTATNYYVIKVDADNIKLALTYGDAIDGTAISIADGVGAAHTLTPIISSSFVSSSMANSLVKIFVPSGVVVTTLGTDSVDFAYTTQDTCEFDDAVATPWSIVGGGISSRRTLRINAVQRTICDGGNRLADLTSVLAGVEGIDLSSLEIVAGASCADDYTVEQDSIDCLPEGCLTNNVTFTYDDLPAFEQHSWEVVPVVPEEDDARKCGIRISAGYIDPRFGNCSFDITDFYETQPIRMEVSLLAEDADNCDFASLPSQQQTKVARIGRQSGEWVVREVIMKSDAYLKHMMQYDGNPRMREAFDQNLLDMVDRTKLYTLYYVTFKASYGANSFRKNEQERFTAVFAFKEGDNSTALLESNILDVLTAKSGVTLHVSGEYAASLPNTLPPVA